METTENRTLDPATRKRIYLEAAEAFETNGFNTQWGFCFWYCQTYNQPQRPKPMFRSWAKYWFPELWECGNKKELIFWFTNHKQRAEALRKAAQMIQL